MSSFNDPERVGDGLSRLKTDLVSGDWARKFSSSCNGTQLDIGYRLVTVLLQ